MNIAEKLFKEREIKEAVAQYLEAHKETQTAIKKAEAAVKNLEILYHQRESLLGGEQNLVRYEENLYVLRFRESEFSSLTPFGDGAVII